MRFLSMSKINVKLIGQFKNLESVSPVKVLLGPK